MLKRNYLKINFEQKSNLQKSETNIFLKFLEKLTSIVIPKANPDFDKKISNIETWLIEFDEEGIPIREIGINNQNEPIMVMPWKNNYGFWTDSKLKYFDFKELFKFQKIDKNEFENNWKSFENNNS